MAPTSSILEGEQHSNRVVPSEMDVELPLTSVFQKSCIESIPNGTEMEGVLRLLVESLVREGKIDHSQIDAILEELTLHEQHGSSALGKGLSFPQLRTDRVANVVGAIGVSADGVPFGAIDNENTKLVFLTISPREWRTQHTSVMNRLVSLMQDKSLTILLEHRVCLEEVYEDLTNLDGQS